jgi:hypothetical protein
VAKNRELLEITVYDDLNENITIFLTQLKDKYYWKYSMLDVELELITDSSVQIGFLLESLDVLTWWSTTDMWNLQTGAGFTSNELSTFQDDVSQAKARLEWALSENKVESFLSTSYGELRQILESLQLI